MIKDYTALVVCILLLTGCLPEQNDKPDHEMVMCTQDVKQCPDGSWVSRIAPDCQFSACPK